MRRALILLLACLFGAAAHAEKFGKPFEEGYELLRNGDAEGALASFQNLLTENPESELVQYSIATALYEKGLVDIEAGYSETTKEALYQAKDGFDELLHTQDPFIQENAPFNSANCTAQLARNMDPHEQYNDRVQALQDAMAGYEKVLRLQPDHEGAKTNLNHVRFLLKTMMQDPPPDQQSPDDSEGGDEGEEGRNEEEEQEGEEGAEQEEGEQGEDESEGEEQSDSENQDQSGDPRDSSQEGDPLEDENIEAILQSLEDKNREEQKNLRRAEGPPQVRGGKWW